MSDNEQLQQIIERAVGQVFAEQMPRLQEQVTQRVMESVPTPTADNSAVAADTGNLRRIVASIYAGTTQKDILRALLDGGSSQCERVALFVVKAGAATGWQARGFADDEAVKDFSLDMSAAPIAHAYQNRVATPANIAEMDSRFVEHFGRPTNEQLLLVPLVLKDKVAALLYADGVVRWTPPRSNCWSWRQARGLRSPRCASRRKRIWEMRPLNGFPSTFPPPLQYIPQAHSPIRLLLILLKLS
jgi:hypothetical protein